MNNTTTSLRANITLPLDRIAVLCEKYDIARPAQPRARADGWHGATRAAGSTRGRRTGVGGGRNS